MARWQIYKMWRYVVGGRIFSGGGGGGVNVRKKYADISSMRGYHEVSTTSLLSFTFTPHTQNLNSGHVLSHMRALFLFSSTLGAIMTAILDTSTLLSLIRKCGTVLHMVLVLGMSRNFCMNGKFMSAVCIDSFFLQTLILICFDISTLACNANAMIPMFLWPKCFLLQRHWIASYFKLLGM